MKPVSQKVQSRTDQHEQNSRKNILLSAKKVFASKGFAGARMEMIAEEAGVNKAMIHYYFQNKENLYQSVLTFLGESREKSLLQNIVNDSEIGSSQKVGALFYYLAKIHFEVQDPEFHRILAWDLAQGKNSIQLLARQLFAPAMELVGRVIEEGVKKGEFVTDAPLLHTWSFFSFIIQYMNGQRIFEGTFVERDFFQRYSKEEVILFLINQTLCGVGRPAVSTIAELVPQALSEEIDARVAVMKQEQL